MGITEVSDRVRFLLNRVGERLWVKPLVICLLSIGAAFLAAAADGTGLDEHVPDVSAASLEALLSTMAASMLVIATLAVASMVAAYDSASRTATPRSFRLVLADDLSQNALSAFVGAFIFSIVALTALENEYFGVAGRFTLFATTILVFAVVIVTFVRWVDGIARLGRMGATIRRVEQATASALDRRRRSPHLQGLAPASEWFDGQAVFAVEAGYVQRVDVEALNCCAAKLGATVRVASLPGAFAGPDRPLAWVRADSGAQGEAPPTEVLEELRAAFTLGHERLFDDDPRFGLVVLAEIAGRALSPAVNDPGTAIQVLGSQLRLLTRWVAPVESPDTPEQEVYDRVEVPALSTPDLLDDAFTVIARDGAGMLEVALRLQKILRALATLADPELAAAVHQHARSALERSGRAMSHPEDLESVRAVVEQR